MMTNPLLNAGERGSLPAAQEPVVWWACGASQDPETQAALRDLVKAAARKLREHATGDEPQQDDLGRMLARIFGGFGDVLEGHAHNVEDAIADVRELGGERNA